MDWLSFFIGVLVGWIVEWAIDIFYWRRRYGSVRQEKEALETRLNQAQQRIRELEAREQERELARRQAPAVEVEAPVAVLDAAAPAIEIEAPEPERVAGVLAAEVAPEAALPAAEPVRPDNLIRIEGIGPKIARVLNDAGILTYAQLAATDTGRLRAILHDAGPNYQLADPTSWPEQARLAAAGAWDEFQALQDRLTAGRQAAGRPR